MELALYHASNGYYTSASANGARGDYYTSPQAHPAFGALLAVQLREMWELLDRPSPFYAVEMGAGDGQLARDVAGYTARMPGEFPGALRYVAIDRTPSPAVSGRVIATRIPLAGVTGCILSNELLDALPVHRFEMRGGVALEVYVTLRDGDLVERLAEPSTPHLADRLRELGADLPEGYRGEVNLGGWTADVSDALQRGFVLTIDYGYEETRSESEGTTQTYYSHTSGVDPYRRIGAQDITAHVDFGRLASEGAAAGLRPLGTVSQAQYLHGLGLGGWLQRLRGEDLDTGGREANMMAMRDLAKPDGLGGFKVLVQEKDTGVGELAGLMPQEGAAGELPLPLLGPDHLKLMAARYPHAAWQPGDTWMSPPSVTAEREG